MPEMMFHICWPDGQRETCYSPSTVIETYLDAGHPYPIEEFVAACRRGLSAASERVREVYGGYGCSRALAQFASIESKAQTFDEMRDAKVRVESFSLRSRMRA